MPSDEMVEKVARALCRLHIQNVARYDNPPPSEDRIQAGVDNCWQHHEEAARAALSAAHAEPVAWRVRERPGFDWRYVDGDPERDPSLRGHERQPLYASPSEAAIRADEMAAIRKEAFAEAAEIAYRICAETRHVTLGDKTRAAIRARGET